MSIGSAAVVGGVLGALAGAAESFQPTLVPRSTFHQGLVTAAVSASGAAAGLVVGGALGAGRAAVGRVVSRGGGTSPSSSRIRVGLFAAASAAATQRGIQLHRSQLDGYQGWGGDAPRPGVAAAGGLAATGVLGLTSRAAGSGVRRLGHGLSARLRGPRPVWTLGVGVVAAGVAGAALTGVKRTVFARLEDESRAPDPALLEAPSNPFTSGGLSSAVDYNTLSREGRRFVQWRVPAEEIAASLGLDRAQEPVRVFVGVESAQTVQDRVALALNDLDRLGAWDRSVILAVSPAGSGYANSVPVEALELARHGDCASVVIQYGLLPSMFSFDKVQLATESYRLLVDRIRERLAAIPPQGRPRFFGYGESLGSFTAQRALMAEPSLADAATATLSGMDAVVFVGTPGGPSLRNQLDGNPRSVHVDRWQDLPDPAMPGTQLWFLDHDADPVTRFTPQLARRRPKWLAPGPRGRNIPTKMTWLPVVTWQQVLFDVAYATQAQSGVFRSVGHDYRADLAPIVVAAFARDRGVDVTGLQELLSKREIARDERLRHAEAE